MHRSPGQYEENTTKVGCLRIRPTKFKFKYFSKFEYTVVFKNKVYTSNLTEWEEEDETSYIFIRWENHVNSYKKKLQKIMKEQLQQ